MGKKGDGLLIAILVVGGLYVAASMGVITIPGITQTASVIGGSSDSGAGYGQLVTLSARAVDAKLANATDTNAEVWSGDTQAVTEIRVNAALTQLSAAMPNSYDGYAMVGNDDFQSTTDRGTDFYYTKYPVSWANKQGLQTYQNVPQYAEETAAPATIWTFFDANTAETTANITVGSGAQYTDANVKIKSSATLALGNPDFNGQTPLALCFNESTAGQWLVIKPVKNTGIVPTPGFLQGKNVIACYGIPTDALVDGAYFTTDLFFQAKPGVNPTNVNVGIIPIDKTYYKNDQLSWTSGYGDESALTSATDVGVNSIAAALNVFVV